MKQRVSGSKAAPPASGLFVVAALAVVLSIGVAGCSAPPAPTEPGTVSQAPESTTPAGPPRSVLPEDRAALERITGASSYRTSMNARLVTDVKQRLQYDRGASLTSAVRIDRDGAPVDLYFLHRTGELRSIAFGRKDGTLLQTYDKFAVDTGDEALALVEQLAAKLPARP